MQAFSRRLYKISSWAIGVFLVVIVAMVTTQIVARNILQISCVWTDEIARYAFIWLTAVGASIQVRDRGHFVIAIFSDALKNKKPLNLFIYLIMFGAAMAMFVYGIRHVIVGANTISVAAHLPMPVVYAAIPTGAACMLFYITELFLEEIGTIPVDPNHLQEGDSI